MHPPVNYTVTIQVDPPTLWSFPPNVQPSWGNFVYLPAMLRVSVDDTITFLCDSPFSLTFKEKTPIDQMELFSHPNGNGFASGPHTVKNVNGQFHYAVAIWDAGRNCVFLDSSCPHVSVN